MNIITELGELLIWIVLILWTTLIIQTIIRSSWNKYRGSLPAMICITICQGLLLTLIWGQFLFYNFYSEHIYLVPLMWFMAGLFFLLWLGFSSIERADLMNRIRKSERKLTESGLIKSCKTCGKLFPPDKYQECCDVCVKKLNKRKKK
jgi:uncharacterized paraquat-inducible protein A